MTSDSGSDMIVKTLEHLFVLIDEILLSPFAVGGKPEPLKHELKGCWSRRINKEHRIVYSVTDDDIIVHACRHHYDR